MFNIEDMVDQLASQVEAIIETPEMIRNTANYQFTLQLRNGMIEGGFETLTAERIVSEMKVELSPDFHLDHPDEFARLVRLFTKAMVNISRVVSEDFEDGEEALMTFARQMSVTFN